MLTFKYILIILFNLVVLPSLFSQKEKMILRDGNESYFGGNPIEASNYYKKSLQEKQNFYKANFNLGSALYKSAELIKSGKVPLLDKKMTPDSAANIVYDQSAQQFEVVAKASASPDTVKQAWHNYGNAKLQQKKYEDAIYGYKKALRIDDKDEETRYNLAYAQKQLQKQEQKNKDNKKDNKDQKKQDQKEQDKEKQENKNEEQKQQEQQQQMSKEQAEQMLNALKNNEKKIQGLRKKKGDSGEKVKIEKDW